MLRLLPLVIALTLSLWGGVGKIAALSGLVAVERSGKTLKPSSGFKIEQQDTIITQPGARAQIVFSDKTTITIGPDSEFSVKEYLYDEQKAPKASFSIAKGAFKAITGQIAKKSPESFSLQTRTATIGIRGTRFLGIIPPKGPETIACTQGLITVAPLPAPAITTQVPVTTAAPSVGAIRGPETPPAATPTPAPAASTPAPVVVSAGMVTTVDVGQISAPRPYTPAELRKLEQATGGGASAQAKPAATEQKQATKSESSSEQQTTQTASTEKQQRGEERGESPSQQGQVAQTERTTGGIASQAASAETSQVATPTAEPTTGVTASKPDRPTPSAATPTPPTQVPSIASTPTLATTPPPAMQPPVVSTPQVDTTTIQQTITQVTQTAQETQRTITQTIQPATPKSSVIINIR
ncbi:MAG: FecR domain-containing protein [Campylobacterales bacterium]